MKERGPKVKVVRLLITQQEDAHLRRLVEIGLHGSSREEVLRGLMLRGFQDAWDPFLRQHTL